MHNDADAVITLTAKELAEREQAAFRIGARKFYHQNEIPCGVRGALYRVLDMAPSIYPIPKVTRLREYTHPNGWTYRCSPDGSCLQTRGFGQGWTDAHTRAQLGELFDLFTRPTEEVDA